MTSQDRYHDALERIDKVIMEALHDAVAVGQAAAVPQDAMTCTPKTLPTRLLMKAAELAVSISPVNAPMFGPMAEASPLDPLHIAVMTSKYWGWEPRTFTVAFMESTPADLKARIISHLNAWHTSCLSFVETTGQGDVRISRGSGGYWSYLGTDIKLIPANRPTMNLQGFTMSTPESEYRRVVRHEVGHSMGFPHEHMQRAIVQRIDPEKAYEYFRRTQGWDRQTVDQQVLTPLDVRSIYATPADQTSIMCYQLPGSITKDGKPILGGVDINLTDLAFTYRIYPRLTGTPVQAGDDVTLSEAAAPIEDWGPEEDVQTPI